MGKRNKGKRFVQQGVDAVTKHAERIPYHTTYAEARGTKDGQCERILSWRDLRWETDCFMKPELLWKWLNQRSRVKSKLPF